MDHLKKYIIYLFVILFSISLFSNANAIPQLSLFSEGIPICTHNGLIYVHEDGSFQEKPENDNYHTNCLDCFSCHFDEIQNTLANKIIHNDLLSKKFNFNKNYYYKFTLNYLKNIRAPPTVSI